MRGFRPRLGRYFAARRIYEALHGHLVRTHASSLMERRVDKRQPLISKLVCLLAS